MPYSLKKSERRRFEVTTLDKIYLEENKLRVQKKETDFKWFDTNTIDNLVKVSNYIQK